MSEPSAAAAAAPAPASDPSKRKSEEVGTSSEAPSDKRTKTAPTSEASTPSGSASSRGGKSGRRNKRSRGDKREARGRAEEWEARNKEKRKDGDTRRQWGKPEGEDGGEKGPRLPKRKVAVLLGFCGTGYNGMQIQPSQPTKTIEGDFFEALVKAGAVSADNATDSGKVNLQRAARTDAGVHAAGNVISLKMIVSIPDVPDIVAHINTFLPPQIRMWGFVRTQNSFDARISCDSRVYEYLLPSHVFIPPAPWSRLGQRVGVKHAFWEGASASDDKDELMKRKRAWRIEPERLEQLRKVVKAFEGSHNFWAYTVGKEFKDRSSQRYMKDLSVRDPQIIDGNEWISLRFYGQSFMLHQIRKMVFMMVNTVRTSTPAELIPETFGPSRVTVPKAPGLGLLLEQPSFVGYNLRIDEANAKLVELKSEGRGPTEEQEPKPHIDFELYREQIDKFKLEHIYNRIRKEELAGEVFGKWIASIDAYDGTDFDYLGATGTIPASAIVTPGESRKAFRELKQKAAEGEGVPEPADEVESDDEAVDQKKIKSGEMEG